MIKDNNTQQKSTRDILNKMSKSIKWIMISSIFGLIPYVNDIFDFLQHLNDVMPQQQEAVITGSFQPSGTVKYKTQVSFRYTVPESGYYTIWNQNREGKLKKLWPDEQISEAIIKGGQSYPYHYSLIANTPHSQEHLIILWSDQQKHPPKRIYSTWNKFKEFIDTHHYQWRLEKYSLQVL